MKLNFKTLIFIILFFTRLLFLLCWRARLPLLSTLFFTDSGETSFFLENLALKIFSLIWIYQNEIMCNLLEQWTKDSLLQGSFLQNSKWDEVNWSNNVLSKFIFFFRMPFFRKAQFLYILSNKSSFKIKPISKERYSVERLYSILNLSFDWILSFEHVLSNNLLT